MSHQDINLDNVLHNQGYRLTSQRQMVLDSVCEIGGHASPEEVYLRVQEKSSAINRATVYRVLKLLRELGLLAASIDPNGRVAYEIAGQDNHHHFICRDCGADFEFPNEEFEAFTHMVEKRYGFAVETDHLTLSGLCDSCQQGEP